MKKIFAVLIGVLCFLCTGLVACDNGENTEGKTFTFYAPDGAPALAIAKFINDNESFGSDATFKYGVVSSEDISLYLNGAKGYGDFVILPVNAASKLYAANSDDPYKMAAVITHGNLFIMSTDANLNAEGLKGKVLGVIGQGLVPDLTLRAALLKAGLSDCIAVGDKAAADKITLRYFSAAQDMIPLLKSDQLSYGLLPEPAATNLENLSPDKEYCRLSLQEMYDSETKAYPQAVLMVKSSIAENYPSVVSGISEKFAGNIEWIKNNPADAVSAVNNNIAENNAGFTPSLNASTITSAVVDACNISWQSAANAKADVKAYINDILNVGVGLDIAPAKAVNDDFFLIEG